ncbi:hypothetical protein PVB08_22385 [Bacillus thuringiensis]
MDAVISSQCRVWPASFRIHIPINKENKMVSDLKIKRAIADAHKKGKLDVVAAVTGVNVQRLRQIMRAGIELTDNERAVLGVHLM